MFLNVLYVFSSNVQKRVRKKPKYELPLFLDLSPDAKEVSLAALSKLSLALSNLTAFEAAAAPGDCLLSTSEAASTWFSFGVDSGRLFGLSVLLILSK